MNARKKQILVLLLISSLLIITCFISGCTKYTVTDSEHLLYLISGYVVGNDSQLPLDSVYVTIFQDEYDSACYLTDSTGFYRLARFSGCNICEQFGCFQNQYDILLRFEKEGYITQDTTIQIKKQGDIIDSLMIYSISE
nr:hypothetical protein [candidate division Zixibacteria bacterium]